MPSVNRPLSPHLQVYRPQLTSILSISHRLMGLALSVGTVFLVWQLVAAASGPAEYATFQGLAGSWLGLLLLVGWSFALFYHLANGIRHLVWDAGYGFDLATTYRSGQIVVVAAIALTVIAWIVALGIWGGR
ncbi:MAG TPA: succinate dehydrogenase, cytochrome b556 subunit [Aliidongia sp.]|nr:succinate dehydrogenase, cytochrome b556 subunit [Aliidongia sp.]